MSNPCLANCKQLGRSVMTYHIKAAIEGFGINTDAVRMLNRVYVTCHIILHEI